MTGHIFSQSWRKNVPIASVLKVNCLHLSPKIPKKHKNPSKNAAAISCTLIRLTCCAVPPSASRAYHIPRSNSVDILLLLLHREKTVETCVLFPFQTDLSRYNTETWSDGERGVGVGGWGVYFLPFSKPHWNKGACLRIRLRQTTQSAHT